MCLPLIEIVDIINERIHPINTSSLMEVLRLGFDPVCYLMIDTSICGKSDGLLKKNIVSLKILSMHRLIFLLSDI